MKRCAPLQRRTPLRATPPAKAEVPVANARCKAKGCRTRFVKRSMNHRACCFECAQVVVEQDKAEKARKQAREHRAKLADVKPMSHWHDLTEAVVNAFIKERDRDQPCISCGTTKTAAWHAGHCLSVGAHPELRYEPLNIHRQCLRCNVHFSGNQAAYIARLPEKIGQEAVDWLLGPHEPAKFTREELAAIRKEFAALTRQLKAQRA